MVWFIRPARADDVDALLVLAGQTGGGFTNLPPDRDALARRIGWSCPYVSVRHSHSAGP